MSIARDTALQEKVRKFLELLQEYDQAYFPNKMSGWSPDSTFYHFDVGRRYIWITGPHLKLGVDASGRMVWQNYRGGFGGYFGAHIDDLIRANRWGRSIRRIHRRLKPYSQWPQNTYDLSYDPPPRRVIRDRGQGAGMTVARTSEMTESMKPVWAEYVVALGYTPEQGAAFAEGYAAQLARLPLLEKLEALANQYDPCMAAGFEAAGIDEEQALQRARA